LLSFSVCRKEKERKRKKIPGSGTVEFQNFSLSSSGVTPLAYSPACLHLLGRFGTGVLWCWSPLVGWQWMVSSRPMGGQCPSGLAGGPVGGLCPGGLAAGGPILSVTRDVEKPSVD
jgi:hypothetical protein